VASLDEEDGALVWTMRSSTDRFRGLFTDDGNTITSHWEQLDDEGAGGRGWTSR
jgi:hypothetical protein